MKRLCTALALVTLLLAAGAVHAQTPAGDAGDAQRLADAGLGPAARVALRQSLAALARSQGDAVGERSQLLAALAAATASRDEALRWPALAALARHHDEQRLPGLAALLGKLALQAQAAAAVPAESTEVHRLLAQSLAEAGRVDEALAVLALLKQQEFRAYVEQQPGWTTAVAPPVLTAQEQDQAQRWAALPPLARARAAGPGAEAAAEAQWAQQAQALLQQLAAEPVAVDAARGRAAPPLAEPALHVHLVSGDTRLTLLLRAGTWVQVQTQDWPRRAVQRDIGALLAQLSRGQPATGALQALYQRLGLPIEQAVRSLGLTRVVLHADGALRYLPMAALFEGRASGAVPPGTPLAFVHQAAPRLAAAQGVGPVEAPGTAPSSQGAPVVKALGVSRATSGYPALKGVASEICAIVAGPVHGLQGRQVCSPDPKRGVVVGEAWLNERFTAQRLAQAAPAAPAAQAAPGAAWLHVGTHFDLRPGQMSRSTLLLGDGSQMSLQALGELDFSGQDLVTLSACETALGGAEEADGREIEGLSLILLRRGARAVLASLWRVDDLSTAALMKRFYEELPRVDPARALQRAQAAVRAMPGWEAPLHWAGFQLTTRP